MAQNQTNRPDAKDNVKKGLELAADIARLKFKMSQAKSRRKNAYTRLGELSYTKYRPRTTAVTEDIENAIAAVVAEITDLNHEIVELELRIKLLKAGA
jgi:seryl-tRNA synthetase